MGTPSYGVIADCLHYRGKCAAKPSTRAQLKRLSRRQLRRQERAVIASQLQPFVDCYTVAHEPEAVPLSLSLSSLSSPRDYEAELLTAAGNHGPIFDFLASAQSVCMMSTDVLLEELDDADVAGCGIEPMGARSRAKLRFPKPEAAPLSLSPMAGSSRSAGPSRSEAPGSSLLFF